MKIPKPVHAQMDRLTIRVEHETAELLKLYAQMVGGTPDYVIEAALKLVFRGDKDFDEYRANIRAGIVHVAAAKPNRKSKAATAVE